MTLVPRVIRNLRKMIGGRQVWSADSELAYYEVTRRGLQELVLRQHEFARSGYFVGAQIAHAMQLGGEDSVFGKDVLDLGAGECLLGGALRIAFRARSVWALDAVPRQIWAAARHHQADPAYRFVIGNASALPFRSHSFDVVTANLVMHHIEPTAPVLREVARVLRPGGIFACSEPSPLLGALAHDRGSDNEAPIPSGRLVGELRAAGFDRVDARHSWVRFNTALLGPLSPGYVIKARMPGGQGGSSSHPDPAVELAHTDLPNLLIDPSCAHATQARAQCAEIHDLLSTLD